MTIRQALNQSRETLNTHNIEDSNLESELLLRHVLKLSRTQLYVELERELDSENERTFWRLIDRRASGEPTAYITGHREFYGLDFEVNYNVLIPRPETELLVDKAIALSQDYAISTIADIGTGCGAVAISLALNLPTTKIYATDISLPALEVARLNCQKHKVTNRIYLLAGDMLDPLPEPVDLIVANLPYVLESELPQVNTVGFEPLLALNGGPDGLDKIRRLCTQLNIKLRPEGHLLLEIGQGQSEAIATFLGTLFPSAKIELFPDLSGIKRVISLTFSQVATNI